MIRRLLLAASALALVALATPAYADSVPKAPSNPPVWKALLDVQSGTDKSAPTVLTTGACPWPARAAVGRMFGYGFPDKGVNIVGNTTAGVSMDGGFAMPVQKSFRDTRVEQPQYLPYRGIYTIRLLCVLPAVVWAPYGIYETRINFTSPSTWVALAPSATASKVGPIRLPSGAYVPSDSPQAKALIKAVRSGKAPLMKPFPGQASASASTAPKPGPATVAAQHAAEKQHVATGAIVLIGMGVLIAIGTLAPFVLKRLKRS